MRAAEEFYKTKAWRKARESYVSERRGIDGGLCEICHELPGLIVHHKKHLTATNWRDPDIALNFGNLQYVCKNCHDTEHGFCGKVKERKCRVMFDEFGNVVPLVENVDF